MGKTQQAEICKKVPRYPATTFYEAIQAFYMQYIVVMSENPGGGSTNTGGDNGGGSAGFKTGN